MQEENKIKQDQIHLERRMREFEERQRNAEKLINEHLIREKDNQIKEQNEMLQWQQALLKEVRS